jgi:hypothetical protein
VNRPHLDPAVKTPLKGHEWRVTWRRTTWSPTTSTKSRAFARRQAAVAFLAKLTADERPDLGPLEVLRLDIRRVGQWAEVSS